MALMVPVLAVATPSLSWLCHLGGMSDAFLDAVVRTPKPTSAGPCDLPILYRDASQFGVFFRVDLDRARDVVGRDASIEPWPVLGKAVAAIYAWEYRDSTVGAYGEVGLGVQCRRKGTRPSLLKLGTDMGANDDQGIWVASLPVTTEAACSAGIEIWGYPKYVTPIETTFVANEASVRLGDELTLRVASLSGPRIAAQPVVTYTKREGRLLRTRIDVDHRVRWGLGQDAHLELRAEGPTERIARRLGLDRARIVAAFRADTFRARLPEGKDLGPIGR